MTGIDAEGLKVSEEGGGVNLLVGRDEAARFKAALEEGAGGQDGGGDGGEVAVFGGDEGAAKDAAIGGFDLEGETASG